MKHIYNTIQESLMDDEDEIFAAADSHILKSWFSEYVKGDYKMRILKNGNVKVTGDLIIKGFDGASFPANLQFAEVNGSLKIEKCPKLENIKDLFIDFAKVKGDFGISNCPKLTSLVGGPYAVEGNLYITGNSSLRSLDGMPQFVWANIYVMKNGKKFTENTIKSYVAVPSLIVCSSEESEEVMVNEAMNEPHLLRLAQQLKTGTIGGTRYTFNDIFGTKTSPWKTGRLKGDPLNIDVAFDEIDSSHVTEYKYANSTEGQKAIRSVISKNGVRGLILFTNHNGEYMFAITSSKRYRILSDEYAPGNFVAKKEWIDLSYTDIMDRADASWGMVIFKWDIHKIGALYLNKKREARKSSRSGMLLNTPEQNAEIAAANYKRYKQLAEQMRAQRDRDFIEIDEMVEKVVTDMFKITKEAKLNPDKYETYDVSSLMEKVYGEQQWVGYQRGRTSPYAGQNGLLKLYEVFTTAYMEVASDGGSSHAREQVKIYKDKIRNQVAEIRRKIDHLTKYR